MEKPWEAREPFRAPFFYHIGCLASIIDLRFWVDFFGYIAKLSAQAGCFNMACFLIRFCFCLGRLSRHLFNIKVLRSK